MVSLEVSTVFRMIVNASTLQASNNFSGDTISLSSAQVLVSNEVLGEIMFVIKFGFLLPLAFIGIITNILNIIVFYLQGFKEGSTVSMTAISVWNLFKSICGFVAKFYIPIEFVNKALGVTWYNVTFPTIDYTSLYAGYVTFALAAFLSLERLLCVWKPFTAKSLLTPLISLLSVIIISVFTFGAYIVVYFIYTIKFEFSQTLNTSVAKFTLSQFYFEKSGIVMVYYQSIGILIPTISFIVMCICSALTVVLLRKSSSHLHQDHTSNKTTSKREKQVSRTLLTIISIYIINLFPRFIFNIGQLAEPEFYNLRKYSNLFVMVALLLFVIDFCNSSSHFFIFLKMSSSFRDQFMKCIDVKDVPLKRNFFTKSVIS
ncbi:peptide receptor GPCR [Biomphalaria glabrata]|nr:G-protein coupled receptor frpr-1 [Biomphalaria glabrata]